MCQKMWLRKSFRGFLLSLLLDSSVCKSWYSLILSLLSSITRISWPNTSAMPITMSSPLNLSSSSYTRNKVSSTLLMVVTMEIGIFSC
ncbi:hypothetical protein TorRG33x02_331840 [Trema orientale]|uniref:Uncharacterized protein n=1 Tax=Trema orientale TaxID=63057 RepID=A0A2P5B5M6_TREOI|nr:hypothetical protein TorRG33x02_331840 [Trema orientale]